MTVQRRCKAAATIRNNKYLQVPRILDIILGMIYRKTCIATPTLDAHHCLHVLCRDFRRHLIPSLSNDLCLKLSASRVWNIFYSADLPHECDSQKVECKLFVDDLKAYSSILSHINVNESG